ncbi:hypothetical protein ACFUJY_34805 [Streptomyces sp. NPDC057249]|uniref:hypothetical protein n=1 Tax=Streptomyces sp. NPDC057249 TaxID=3346067 RepID=UPI003629E315
MSTLPPFARPFPVFGRKPTAPAAEAPEVEVPPMPAHPPVAVAAPPAEEPAAEADEMADAAETTTDTRAQRRVLRRRVQAPAAEAESEDAPAREPNPRWRWLGFNAAAAGAGHLAIWTATGDSMAGAHYMARMSVSVPELAAAGLTLVASYAGWRAGGLLRGLPGGLGRIVRPAGALLAALWGQGTAPLVRDALDVIEPWGTLLSPLLAVSPVAAACWWGLDRTAANAAPPLRWAARVPLATVTLSALLYAPGALL